METNPKLFEKKIDRSKIDYSSVTYHEIHRYLESMINALRKDNDKGLDAEATATLRGRIAENRTLLTNLEPLPDVNTDKMRAR